MPAHHESPHASVKVVVVYYSRFGVVKLLAERIAEGARRVDGVEAELLQIEDRPVEELRTGETEEDMARRRAVLLNRLASADALIVGAPSYFGSMASPIKRFFEELATANPPPMDRSRPWRHFVLHGKVGAAFTASGTPHGGNEQTLHSILTLMMHLGMLIVAPGQRSPILEQPDAPYGATAISGPAGDRLPSDQEQEEARALGEQVAEVAVWLRLGRSWWEQLRIEGGGRPIRPGLPSDPSA